MTPLPNEKRKKKKQSQNHVIPKTAQMFHKSTYALELRGLHQICKSKFQLWIWCYAKVDFYEQISMNISIKIIIISFQIFDRLHLLDSILFNKKRGVKKPPVLYRWFDYFFCICVYRVYYIRIESIQMEENIFILFLVHISSRSIKMIKTEVTGFLFVTIQVIDRVIDTSFGT